MTACHSRVRVLKFPVGGAPFDILLSVGGSNDFVVSYPGVGIPAYSEPVSVVAFIYDYPLQLMR